MTAHVGGLLVLYAETPLHPGAGTALGIVDLPVQRERHTQFPIIPGTAVKGVLRDAARRQVREAGRSGSDANAESAVVAIFGGAPGSGQPEAGALAVGDARLLALPVRSLRGVFAWVTCAQVLQRLVRDAALVGLELPGGGLLAAPGRAIVAQKDSPLISDGRIVLEEFDFAVDGAKTDETGRLARRLSESLLPQSEAFAPTRARFVESFCILSDDDFSHFARHSTEVVARIGLDPESKTVKTGALFYQELVPADSIFYAVVIADAVRARTSEGKRREEWDAGRVLAQLRDTVLPPYLQLGANETTGRGFCATHLATGGAAS